ncbi:hypothetical protein SynWH8103_00110 [Synechococcus sp. WH 8103]|nr:hypothetical protein SynWH8103_00110 [Synechococcus sp. WH 8103]
MAVAFASTGWLKRQCSVLAPNPWIRITASGASVLPISDQPMV